MKFKELARDYSPILLRDFILKNWHIIQGISDMLEVDTGNITPRIELILSAFHLVSMDPHGLLPNSVKVVFLFQDPYPTPGVACGIATCTLNGYAQPTLKNMFKRLKETYRVPYQVKEKRKVTTKDEKGIETTSEQEVQVTKYKDIPEMKSGDIRGWASQGVLLWNAALTTRENETEAHMDYWSLLTEQMIKWMSETFPFLVFVLFGKKSQLYKKYIDANKHHIYETSHPAGRGYNYGFHECNIYNEVNQSLKDNYREQIKWENVDYI